MICSKCGNSIPKEDEFCPKCGHKITAEEHSYETGVVRNSTMELLRSGLFGAVCWCLAGFVACIVIGWFFPLNLESYADALRRLSAPENIAGIFDISGGSGRLQIVKILLMFIVSLPILISAVGLLILRSHAKGNSQQTGLDMVKIGIKIGIIYFSMMALGCVGAGVVLIVFGGYGDRTSLVWTIPAFSLIMLFIVAALVLLVKMMSFAQVIKEAVINDDFSEEPSGFVRVVSIMVGAAGATAGTAVLLLTFDVLTAIALILWSLAQIFIGILIKKVKIIDERFYGGLYDTIYKSVTAPGGGRMFCTRCGRELYGGEICTCIPKRYVSPPPGYAGMGAGGSPVSKSSAGAGTSTGSKYFKKAKNL